MKFSAGALPDSSAPSPVADRLLVSEIATYHFCLGGLLSRK